jgi:hypothetical protein
MLAGWTASVAAADLPTKPNPVLTPGAVATTDAGKGCRLGYARAHRHVTAALRAEVVATYGVPLSEGYRAELDHLVPWSSGAPASPRTSGLNRSGSAERTRKLENRLRGLVCARQLPLEQDTLFGLLATRSGHFRSPPVRPPLRW